MRREGFFGSEPVFHGDNNIYHHRGGKEGGQGSETEIERGRKLENMRLWKEREVLTEMLTRLLGWQTAVSQAKGLVTEKELCLTQ